MRDVFHWYIYKKISLKLPQTTDYQYTILNNLFSIKTRLET